VRADRFVAAALFEGRGAARWVWAAAGVALVACNLARPIIRVPTTKGVKVETTRFEQWNAFSPSITSSIGAS